MGYTEDHLVCDHNGTTECHHCYDLSPSTLAKNRIIPGTNRYATLPCLATSTNTLKPFVCRHQVRRCHIDCPYLHPPTTQTTVLSALDVLSTNRAASEKFVIGLCHTGKRDDTPSKSSKVMESGKMAFSLACIEQLIPNIGEERAQSHIFDVCVPCVIRLLDVLIFPSRLAPLPGTFGITGTGRFTNHRIQSFSLC